MKSFQVEWMACMPGARRWTPNSGILSSKGGGRVAIHRRLCCYFFERWQYVLKWMTKMQDVRVWTYVTTICDLGVCVCVCVYGCLFFVMLWCQSCIPKPHLIQHLLYYSYACLFSFPSLHRGCMPCHTARYVGDTRKYK